MTTNPRAPLHDSQPPLEADQALLATSLPETPETAPDGPQGVAEAVLARLLTDATIINAYS